MEDLAREIKNLKLTVETLREQIHSIQKNVKGVPIRGQLGGYSVIRRNEVLEILAGQPKKTEDEEQE